VAEHDLVEVHPAEPLDALRLAEQLERALLFLRTTAASKVPPPRSYTATVLPASTRSAEA